MKVHIALEGVELAFAEAGRVLRPGGSLVVTDFHPDATERGWKRTFADPTTGAVESIFSHAHRSDSYVGALESAMSRPRRASSTG